MPEKPKNDRHTSALSHGAFSNTIRQRYSDRRTAEGRRLNGAIEAITEDLGGPENMNAAQSLILSSLRAKLIVVFQISDYLDFRESVLDPSGELIGSLKDSFLKYSSSIRTDLQILYALRVKGQRSSVPKLEDIIAGETT